MQQSSAMALAGVCAIISAQVMPIRAPKKSTVAVSRLLGSDLDRAGAAALAAIAISDHSIMRRLVVLTERSRLAHVPAARLAGCVRSDRLGR